MRCARRSLGGGLSILALTAGALLPSGGCEPKTAPERPERDTPTTTDGRVAIGRPGNEDHPRYSPDGRWIAFTHERGGRERIFIAPRGGGEPRRLTSWTTEDRRPTWSPDGDRVAFQSDAGQGIWVVELDGGGEPRRLTPAGLYAGAPDWSSDGERFVYQNDSAGSMDLWIFEIEDGTTRRLTDHPDNEWHPRWSPDGRSVVFYTTWDDRMTDVWRIDADGSSLTQLTEHVAEDWRPAWSPDGRSIVFSSGRGGKTDLWRIAAEGGEPVRVTDDRAAHDYVDWAPDGRTVIARTDVSRSHIYQLAIDSQTLQRWVAGSDAELEVFDPVASSDGREIVFHAAFRDTTNLFIGDASGRGPARHVAASAGSQDAVAWAADGARLFYVENPGGGPSTADLWTLTLDSDETDRLTESGGVRDVVRCGDHLVYSLDPGVTYVHDLWSVPSAGGEPQPLLESPNLDYRVTDCSADGRTALLAIVEGGRSRLAAVDLRTLAIEPIATAAEAVGGSAEGARLSPDGLRLAYLSNAAGAYDLYVSKRDGAEPVRLTDTEESESWPTWLNDDTLLFSAPSGGRDLWEFDLAPPPAGRD